MRISPRTLTVNTGATFNFSAQALDASGNVVPNTPIIFVVQNPALGSVNAATGAGTVGNTRGTTTVFAQLLTGPTDGATLTVRPVATALSLISGAGQTANVNATLANPVVVRVAASDGGTLDGVPVVFSVSGGGTVGRATVSTDASGLASTTWKLGGIAGTQTLTASSAGLSSSPLSVTATARALEPVRLLIATQPPASTQAGNLFGLVANAVDATGALAAAFTGPVSVSLADGAPVGALLTGTLTVNAVAGVATLGDLRLNVPGAYTLNVRTPSLLEASSSTFNIVPGSARRLAFQGYLVAGTQAGATLDAVTVQVRDSLNNPVTTYTGPVTVDIAAPAAAIAAVRRRIGEGAASTPPSSSIANASASSAITVNAVGGLATFVGFRFTVAGTYQLTATGPGLLTANGPAFSVFPGPASLLQIIGGNGQSAVSGATLPIPVVMRVTDAFGNTTGGAGRSIAFAASAGGSASPSSGPTNAGSQLSTTWTLGATASAQTLTATSAGLGSAAATAAGAAGPTGPTIGCSGTLPLNSSHAPDYLLGSKIAVSSPVTLTHIALIARAAGPMVKMALYTDVGGNPGTLVASTGAIPIGGGGNEFPVTNVALAPGTYWIMGVFNVNASVGIDYSVTDVVK